MPEEEHQPFENIPWEKSIPRRGFLLGSLVAVIAAACRKAGIPLPEPTPTSSPEATATPESTSTPEPTASPTPEPTTTPESLKFPPRAVYVDPNLEGGGTVIIYALPQGTIGVVIHRKNIPCSNDTSTQLMGLANGPVIETRSGDLFSFDTRGYGVIRGVLNQGNPQFVNGEERPFTLSKVSQGQRVTCAAPAAKFNASFAGTGADFLVNTFAELLKKEDYGVAAAQNARTTLTERFGGPL